MVDFRILVNEAAHPDFRTGCLHFAYNAIQQLPVWMVQGMPIRDEIQPVPSRHARFLRTILLVLFLLLATFYLLDGQCNFIFEAARRDLNQIETQVHEHFVLALLAFTLVYILLVALSLPVTAVLTILAGALFGRWVGAGVSSVAATAGAVLAFLGSRYLFHDRIERRWGQRLHKIQRGFDINGGYFLFMMRVVAVVPYFAINIGMGLTRIPTWKFTWVSWLGMLPVAFVYANGGTEIEQIQSPRDVLSPSLIGSLAALGIFPLAARTLVRWVLRWRRNQKALAA